MNKALTLLDATCLEMKWDELAELSIGQRDALLISLREQTFGTKLNVFAKCPQCQGHIEFIMDVANIRDAGYSVPAEKENELSVGNLYMRFRLLNSLDLAAVVNCNDITAARNLLVQRCVLHADRDSVALSSEELPEEIIDTLVVRLAECDPQSEVLLNLVCPECAHNWQMIFDIVSFFWKEISIQAKRLLREVHTLALAYGWSEADVLAMSTARRQFYLEMVS
ncbi:MAG: hypothetical protein SCH70_00995 [Candidatus Methanoperedens sp.]|nr:hypothetical protein [Candidatus Methanoperedens sp.]